MVSRSAAVLQGSDKEGILLEKNNSPVFQWAADALFFCNYSALCGVSGGLLIGDGVSGCLQYPYFFIHSRIELLPPIP